MKKQIFLLCLLILLARRDGAGKAVKENSSVFSLTQNPNHVLMLVAVSKCIRTVKLHSNKILGTSVGTGPADPAAAGQIS